MVVAGAAIALALSLTGCSGPERPRVRIGSLPFPGVFTLYAEADPDDLGSHQYAAPLFGGQEVERGTIYTERAGFLDIAHIRMTIDWARYCATVVEPGLIDGRDMIRVVGPDMTCYDLTIAYPDGWRASLRTEREMHARELSAALGQRLAYLIVTWHEIATWHGYKTTIIVPEDGSAFTYDDVASHAVGVRIAADALADRAADKDERTTELLKAELNRLGVVPVSEMRDRIELAKKKLWRGGFVIKRQLDIGLETGAVRPWLVDDEGVGFGMPIATPRLTGALRTSDDGPELRRVEIIADFMERARIAGSLPGRPRRFDVDAHLKLILTEVRAEMINELDADAVGVASLDAHQFDE